MQADHFQRALKAMKIFKKIKDSRSKSNQCLVATVTVI